MPQTLLLSVGSDAAITGARDLVLRSAGYIVVSAISIKEAAYLFQYGDFDLVVLCHTLAQKDRERLTSLIRASGSRIPIVCVAGTDLPEQNPLADATLSKEPVLFLVGLEDLLSRHGPAQPTPVPHIEVQITSVKSVPKSVAGSKPQKREGRRVARAR